MTGGAGFVGSHLVEKLVSKGEHVLVLDNFSGGKAYRDLGLQSSKVEIIEGSILDQILVSDLMEHSSKCYHLAAAVGVGRITSKALESLEINIKGTENIFKAALKFNVRTLLASSSEIYGRNPKMPLSEESERVLGSPKIARWTYSEGKAIDEFYAFELYRKNSFEITIARLFNTVGSRQSSAYGMVLPRFIEAALSNKPLIVHGNGSQRRSFCSVSDVVVALIGLMNTSETIGQAYNIGSPNEISIYDLASRVIEITNSKSQIIFKNYNEVFGDSFEEPERRVPDISKISKAIGWKPTKNLNEIIIEVVDYVVTNEN